MSWKLTRSRKGPWFLLLGPYDETLIADLKDAIPSESRQYMASMQAWRIDEEWAPQAQAVIDRRVAELEEKRD